MTNFIEPLVTDIKKIKDVDAFFNVPAKSLTTFGGVGIVDTVLKPKNVVALKEVLYVFEKFELQPKIIGKGANTIIDDLGLKIPLIQLDKLNALKVEGNEIVAGAGVFGNELLKIAFENQLSGLEFLAGIPSTVGGLVKMNAGAFGSEIADFLTSIECLQNGKVEIIVPQFAYRKSFFDGIAISAKFKLDFEEKDEIAEKIKKNLQFREKKQPKERSCGSVFKAIDGISVGKYVDEIGLKGKRCGDAQISNVHGNFIVNLGNAKAKDFLALVKLIENSLEFELGIRPEREFVLLKEENEWNFEK